MGTIELFIQLTSQFKWYAGYCKHNTASMIKKRFSDGTLSSKKIEEIFKHFGYVKSIQEQWQKK
jgi:hypothetical protein